MAEEASRKRGTAAELLSEWRAAERDLVAAQDTLDVATLAATAAGEAVVAARETSEAAELSQQAAQRAQMSAARTAAAADVTARVASKDQKSATASLESATQAESDAADRFHEAERQGFPKD